MLSSAIHKALVAMLALVAAVGVAGLVLVVHRRSATPPPQTQTVTTDAAGPSTYSYQMPSSSTPTQCSVWLQGHDAEIIYTSSSVQVDPACDSWIKSSAAGGELWIKNELATVPADVEQNTCSLTSSTGAVTAVVKDEAGGTYGQEACTRLIAGDWTES
jgi:hypothetical protein